MATTFAYAQLLTIGISATTISAAVIGDPLPVVGPAVAAGLLVAGHHVHQRERGDGVDDVEADRPDHTTVYSGGPHESGRRPGRGDDQRDDRGDDLGDLWAGDGARTDGGRR